MKAEGCRRGANLLVSGSSEKIADWRLVTAKQHRIPHGGRRHRSTPGVMQTIFARRRTRDRHRKARACCPICLASAPIFRSNLRNLTSTQWGPAMKIVLSGLMLLAHSWYPWACCHDQHCHPVPCETIKAHGLGLSWNGVVFTREMSRTRWTSSVTSASIRSGNTAIPTASSFRSPSQSRP
jgi:hypothetical protein